MDIKWSTSLLSSFSGKEIKMFAEFLNSPFFNTSDKVLQLFKVLRHYHTDYKGSTLSNEGIYKRLYPDRKFKLSTVNNLYAKLHKKLLDYLAYKSLSKNKTERNALILKEIGSRELDKEFARFSHILEDKLDRQAGLHSDSFLDRYRLMIARFDYGYLHEKISKEMKIKRDIKNVNDAAFYLYTYFFNELTAIMITKFIYSFNYEIKEEHDLVEEATAMIDTKRINELSKKHKHGFILKLNLCLYEMFKDLNDEEKYKAYRNELKKCSSQLAASELSFHYLKLVSYCIIQNILGISDKWKELFDIFCEMLEKKLYREGKTEYLDYELYRDILIHAIRMKKYRWIEEFIKEYSREGPPDERDNMYHYGYARLYFETYDYKKALHHIKKVHTGHAIFKYDYKNLMLKVYYETGEYENALLLIKTYSEFLRSKDVLSPERKKRYAGFIKYAEQLIKISAGDKKINLKLLHKNIKRADNVSYKKWLLDKLNLLRKPYRIAR